MFASKKSAFGAMRVKRKDVETLVSAVRGYDALYKQSENNDDIDLLVRVVHVANSLLDVVGLDRERDAVETLLYSGKALPKTTKKKNTLTSSLGTHVRHIEYCVQRKKTSSVNTYDITTIYNYNYI